LRPQIADAERDTTSTTRTESNLNRLIRGATAALAMLAVCAPAAQAAQSGETCPARPFSSVFASWSDNALYTLAPGGDFESGAPGWTLTGSARVDAGGSGFAPGTRSLSIPAGASALSPTICVEKNYPSWRFAARSGGGKVAVEVLYPKKTKDTGTVVPTGGWSLSPVLKFSTGQFKGATTIQVRFTAVGQRVQLDDVYIDPRFHR
jgi:hypothetical protein